MRLFGDTLFALVKSCAIFFVAWIESKRQATNKNSPMEIDEIKRFENYYQLREDFHFESTREKAKQDILSEIQRSVNNGNSTFVIGLKDEFDLFVASCIKECRNHRLYSTIHYYVVLCNEQQLESNDVVKSADSVIITSQEMHNKAFQLHREQLEDIYLAEQLGMDICYFDPYGKDGTLYAYNRFDDIEGESNDKLLALIDYFTIQQSNQS